MGYFLPDPRGAGLHQAFQFSYVRSFVRSERASEQPTFVSLDQILVPTHSLRDKGTWELGNLGAGELGNLGTWELGNLGTWELGNFGTLELGN